MKSFREYLKKVWSDYCGNLFTEQEYDEQIRILPIPSKRKDVGDFSLPIFKYTKAIYHDKDDMPVLAEELLEELVLDKSMIKRAEYIKGYINFHVNEETLVNIVLNDVLEKGENYGRSDIGENKLVVIDYSAPNIGKPLHVGHIRSTILGDSVIRILNFTGYKTHGINYLGDIGLHIGKILTAYQKWGNEEKLNQNPEEEILNLYIKFCKLEKENEPKKKDDKKKKKEYAHWEEQEPEEESEKNLITQEAKRTLELLENNDQELIKLWKFIEESSLKTFDRVYSLLDVKFDEMSGQSRFSEKGKQIVRQALENRKAYQSEDGAIKIELKEYKLPEKVVLRSDGTAIYSTQDIGAAISRKQDHDFDQMLYFVASEQKLYFQQLFACLDKIGHDWSKNCKHISFGMINLADGKMSTREGQIVYLEEVLNKSVDMAKQIIEKKNPDLNDKEKVAQIVGVGAIKYMVLGVDYVKNIDFSWDRALNFEGNSAPYIQYSYARAASILRKVDYQPKDFKPQYLNTEHALNLVKKIGEFELITEVAAKTHRPNIVANYAYELASLFNQFYGNEQVVGAGEQEESKLVLVKTFQTTAKNALKLLGIDVPEEM